MTHRRLLLLLVLSLFALPVIADSAEDAARRFLALAYEGRLDALPKSAQANTKQFETSVRNSLRVRVLRVESIDVRELAVNGDAATASLWITIHETERNRPDGWSSQESFPLRLKLVREAGVWVVSAIEYPDHEFADQLIAASEDARAQLLRDNPQRITRSLARAIYDRALAMLNGGKFADAGRAAALSREIAIAAGDKGGEVLALGAAAFAALEKPDQPRLAEEALTIAKTLGDPDILARAWYNRGRAVYETAERKGAIVDIERNHYYDAASRFAERAEDPTLLIRIVYSMANVALAHSDYVTALRHADRVLPIAREVGDVVGQVTLESVVAGIYFGQGDSERGMVHHSRALELAEKHRLYAYPSLLLRSGTLLVGQGRFDEAHAVFAKALFRDAHGVVKTIGAVPGGHIATSLVNMAEIEAANGRFDEAECLLREAAVLWKSPGERSFFELAREHAKRGNHVMALRYALPSLAGDLYDDQRVQALMTVARAYRGLGQSDRALASIVEAIDIRESLHTRTAGDEQQRARAADESASLYEIAAEIALDRGEPAEALAFLERGRAFVLTDILENGRPGAVAAADAAKDAERIRREKELARLSIEHDRARAAGERAAIDPSAERLRLARAEHATFLDAQRARSARRHSTRRFIDGRGLLELTRRLPQRLAAVEYLITDEQLHVFVVRGGTVIHRQADVPRKVVAERADRFVDALSNRALDVQAAARDLHQLLIEPIEKDLATAEALLVIPDEALWRVPFAALADSRDRFVVERWSTLYAPSITAYSLIAASGEDTPSTPVLFAVGNPKLDLAAKNAVVSFYRDADLNPLPDAEREVDSLRPLYDRRHSVVLKGDEATESRTKSAIGGAKVVHFATHALFDDSNPMYSRLALARDANAADDGWLESWEVAQLDLDADIVVLSACETARGRIGGGEGVVGMAWSFFLAGARSTVATQWRVASASTARFMVDFHRSFRTGAGEVSLRKAHALREAQLQLMRDRRSRHPYYWAPFVLFGS